MTGDEKTLGNTDTNTARSNVKDIVFWGNGDTFKLISKASSRKEGWMKSTKAMEIKGVGCVIQVTTQQLNDTSFHKVKYDSEGNPININYAKQETIKHSVIAEALVFVPGVKIHEEKEEGEIISRKLIRL